jgi:hypothetical protein
MIRHAVQEFVGLGPLPASDAAETDIATHESALHRITPPVTLDEAVMLSKCFGPDDCYGLAWTLVHLIETAPESPVKKPAADENEWTRRLWDRAQRGRAKP